MTALTTPSLVDHLFGYNGVNRNTSYQTPMSGSYQYTYDKDRRLDAILFPSGDRIDLIYDTIRLSQIQTPEGTIDLSYLCGTKLGSIANGTETISFGYDGKLITSETLSGALNKTLSYTYNNDFNVQSLTYAGDSTPYDYDNDGLLIGAGPFTIYRNAGNGLPEQVSNNQLHLSRSFNDYGEVASRTGTAGGQGVIQWALTRDADGRINMFFKIKRSGICLAKAYPARKGCQVFQFDAEGPDPGYSFWLPDLWLQRPDNPMRRQIFRLICSHPEVRSGGGALIVFFTAPSYDLKKRSMPVFGPCFDQNFICKLYNPTTG